MVALPLRSTTISFFKMALFTQVLKKMSMKKLMALILVGWLSAGAIAQDNQDKLEIKKKDDKVKVKKGDDKVEMKKENDRLNLDRDNDKDRKIKVDVDKDDKKTRNEDSDKKLKLKDE
jgi:hypothetical protein